MNILLIWIKKPLPEEIHYTLMTFKRFLRKTDNVTIIVDDTTKDIEEFNDFNKIHFNDFLSKDEQNHINKCSSYIENMSDLLRFKWLSKNDGFYFDIDTIHFRDFHDLIEKVPYKCILFKEKKINKCHYLCGIVYSTLKELYDKIYLKTFIVPKHNKKFTKYVDCFIKTINQLLNNNSNTINIKSEQTYCFYGYEEQINLWNQNDINIVIESLLKIKNNNNVYGLALMKDTKNGKMNREKYVIEFIKKHVLN